MARDGRADLPHIPELEGDYDLIRELGRGGSAVVYLAREVELGRDVAIKLIRQTHLRDEEAVARLVREARTVGRLQHPNIVMLLGTRRLGTGGLALILQFVPGRTLAQHIRERGPLPFSEAERILVDVSRGLAYAHRQRIVHRDIKPENVYLDEDAGLARLGDFGIARAWDSDSGLTLPGTAIGTPTYMSPEQVEGGDVDGRSDIYALGLVAWEMLSGRKPWAGESLYTVIYKQKHETLPDLATLRPDTPPHLGRAVAGALHKDPARRWQRVENLLRVLEEGSRPGRAGPVAAGTAAAGPGPSKASVPGADPEPEPVAEPSPAPSPPRPGIAARRAQARRRKRRRLGSMAALLGIAAVVGGLGASWVLGGPDRALFGRVLPFFEGSAGDLGEEPYGTWTPEADRDGSAAEPGSAGTDPDDPGTPFPAAGEQAVQPQDPESASGDEEEQNGAPDDEAQEEGTAADDEGDPDEPEPPASAPAAIQGVTGSGQEGETGRPLPEPLRLRVVDDMGRGVPGRWVRFEVTSGGGRVASDSVETDDDGFAEVEWTLGGERGRQEVLSRVTGSDALRTTFAAEATPPRLAPRPTLAAGGMHSCRLDAEGSIACWGDNGSGQLGDAGTARRSLPAGRLPGGPFSRLATGLTHTCALDAIGRARCWGANESGQLGDGTAAPSTEPVEVAGEHLFVEIRAGVAHTCARTRANIVYCWGSNAGGQLGDGTTTDRASPVRVDSGERFVALATGWRHTCALDGQGTAYCWGTNTAGELGRSSMERFSSPARVAGGDSFDEISAGNAHTCGLTTGGRVLCWGDNEHGQLGNGTRETRRLPTPIDAEGPFTAVTAGAVHGCALSSGGAAFCWGRNIYGQIGDGSTTDRDTPTGVEGDWRFARLRAFGSHTCGATPAGDLLCWGYNAEGQLGDGTRQNRSAPVPVGGEGG